MPNTWGRPPQNDGLREIKGLVFWVFIIGVGVFLLFPNFFQGIYDNLIESTEETELSEVTLSQNSNDIYDFNSSDYSSSDYYSSLYSNFDTNNNEVTTGYWIIFVGGGAFKQLSVSYETYNFLHSLIQNDKEASSTQSIILVANGQILKYEVSEEIYDIIDNITTINGRMIDQG